MTDHTSLSHADAQAVLKAACIHHGLFNEEIVQRRRMVAAVLRAAVKQCQIEWNYHPDYPETEWVVVASDLIAIADELESND